MPAERHIEARRRMRAIKRSYGDHNDVKLSVIRRSGDIRSAKASGKLGLILGSEGAKYLEGSVAALRNLAESALARESPGRQRRAVPPDDVPARRPRRTKSSSRPG